MAKAEATVEELVSKIERFELRLPEMQQPWAHTWTNLNIEVEPSMRTVNVHEAKTQFSRLIDAAHAGETILVAKDGKPWARLVPLEPAQPRRQPGVLRGLLQLPSTEELLAPLPPEELDAADAPLPV
jgi:prevent-host-death family protein